jgi:short-chain fatty acids transporter
MLERIGNAFESLVRRFMPDPFVLALALTFVSLIAAMCLTPHSWTEVLSLWLDGPPPQTGVAASSTGGFWVLLEFAMQMILIVVTGEAVATAPQVRRALGWLASLPRGRFASVFFVSFVALVLGWLHWGFGLLAAAVLAREVAQQARARGTVLHYPLLGAAAYTALLIWHAGLSGSAPLSVNSGTHFLFKQIGRIGLDQTVFTPMNLGACALLLVTVPWLIAALQPRAEACAQFDEAQTNTPAVVPTKGTTLAERIDASPVPTWLLAALGFTVLGIQFSKNGFSPNLNVVNFIMLLLGMLLYGSPVAYMKAAAQSMRSAAGIAIQFPLYGGIMGVVQGSGLGHMLADFFSSFATAHTLPFFTYLSSVLSKLFVPSGGGEWAIEGPVMLLAAERLHADIGKTILAVAYGNMVGNMFQPFWALPLLGIMNLKARDIMGYCLVLFCFALPVLGAVLWLFG